MEKAKDCIYYLSFYLNYITFQVYVIYTIQQEDKDIESPTSLKAISGCAVLFMSTLCWEWTYTTGEDADDAGDER